MEFTDVVYKRRMVRAFTDESVAPEVVDRILDLARHSPSAGYTQRLIASWPRLRQVEA